MTSLKLLSISKDFVPEYHHAKFGGNWTTNIGKTEGGAQCAPPQPIWFQKTPAWIGLKHFWLLQLRCTVPHFVCKCLHNNIPKALMLLTKNSRATPLTLYSRFKDSAELSSHSWSKFQTMIACDLGPAAVTAYFMRLCSTMLDQQRELVGAIPFCGEYPGPRFVDGISVLRYTGRMQENICSMSQYFAGCQNKNGFVAASTCFSHGIMV